MLAQGYAASGLNELLEAASAPKGSFYHYFRSKEDFGLQVLDLFAAQTLASLNRALEDRTRTPLKRLQAFFESLCTQYEQGGCKRGCLLGTLAQELAGLSEPFRRRIARHFGALRRQFAACLAEARQRGEIPVNADAEELADVLMDGWQGALIRMKIERSIRPVERFIRFYFTAVIA